MYSCTPHLHNEQEAPQLLRDPHDPCSYLQASGRMRITWTWSWPALSMATGSGWTTSLNSLNFTTRQAQKVQRLHVSKVSAHLKGSHGVFVCTSRIAFAMETCCR